ncbi:MAG TPA: molybdopterin-binding protein [Tissierellia bacterium]|nr:molybdopterin-binding protein [Tissierellia bacterium]
MAEYLINKAVIIPTGDEIRSGIILDTDSPMIMQVILSINSKCTVIRNEPIPDVENLIIECIKSYIKDDVDLIVLIGGSGGGHRYSSTLAKDYTHTSLNSILDKKFSTELYGKNGHMWSKLICGKVNNTIIINVPGPYQEARAAIEAFKNSYEENSDDLKQINVSMAEAVKSQYYY